MASVTRVNPALAQDANQPTGRNIDVLYTTLQMAVFKIVTTVNEETALTTSIGGQIESLSREFGTTAALFEADGEEFIFIGDAHALDIDAIAIRASRALGGIGKEDGDLAGEAQYVTVTKPTSLFDL
jgi:hypothetical protein